MHLPTSLMPNVRARACVSRSSSSMDMDSEVEVKSPEISTHHSIAALGNNSIIHNKTILASTPKMSSYLCPSLLIS